jgi:HYR domain/Secretion system C-terminal sorting domain/Domain of unknown function DUF11/Polysaccharide deacetylase
MNKTLLCIACLLWASTLVSAQRIVINFDAPINTPPSVSKATLRYDKDFAYSLTFDDGSANAYTCAYPLLQGGNIACSGTSSAGLGFTDGCGNRIPFRAAVAINANNNFGTDNHLNTPNKLTWAQIDELYDKGWDVLNHSNSHKSRFTHTMAYQDYVNEIELNKTNVRNRTRNKINLSNFVVPSGDGIYQDIAYSLGSSIVFDQGANTIGVGGLSVNSDFTPNGKVVHRQLLEDALNSGNDRVGAAASRGASGNKIWYNEFTHSVNGATGLDFYRFQNHIQRISNNWGQAGTDRVWFAPLQEVFEYLTVRRTVSYTASVNGNQLILDFNLSQLPSWLRRKPLTLVVNSSANFSSVTIPQGVSMTHSGRSGKKIINLEFGNTPTTNPCDSDNIPPVLVNCPQNISLSTANTTAQATWTAPTATDNCTTTPSVTSVHSSGTYYPIGTTTVTYTATDARGNKGTCSFKITVTQIVTNPCDSDVTPPTLSNCPQNISLATSTTTAQANWIPPSVTDNCTTTPLLSSNYPSGARFPLDTTTVIYTATDAKGNKSMCRFNVVVTQVITNTCDNDTIRPTLNNCPNNISITTPNANAIATWAIPTASDNCLPPPSVSSSHASGMVFPIGSTTVLYMATDGKGNQTTCSFIVTVSQQTTTSTCKKYAAENALLNCTNSNQQPFLLRNGSNSYKLESNIEFIETSSSTATLRGTLRDDNWRSMPFNLTFSGKTSKLTGQKINCISPTTNNSSWVYYTNITGTIGLPSGDIDVLSVTDPLQIGVSANTHDAGELGGFARFIAGRNGNSTNFELAFRLDKETAIACGTSGGGGNPSPSLQISIKSSTPQYKPWTTLVYTISVKNNGTTTANNVKVFFEPAALQVTGGESRASAGNFMEVCPGNLLCREWAILSLAAGATATLDIPLFVLNPTGNLVSKARLVTPSVSEDLVTVSPMVSALNLQRTKASQFIPIVVNSLFPNPSDNELQVKIESLTAQKVTIQFSNLAGKAVYTEQRQLIIGEQTLSFDVSGLAQGIYLLQMSNNEMRHQPVKFVKM